MSANNARLDDIREWVVDHRYQCMAVLALLAVIALIIGLSLTWFVNSKNLSTVAKIQVPADPKVLGPNQTSIEPLEVSYNEARGDKKDSDGNVTIDRAFCVESKNEKEDKDDGGQAFELQLANTTNITNLKIKVYRVTAPATKEAGDVNGLDGLNNPFSWSKTGDPIAFELINPQKEGDDSLAKLLESGLDDQTFSKYKSVQKNANPLYRYKRFEKRDLDGYNSSTGKANDATNFILECTWNEKDNAKETDMVYLIARSVKGN